MKTLIELIGTTPPAHLDGRSLAPFLRGQDDRKAGATPRIGEFDFRSIEKGTAEKHFGLKPQQCNLAVFRMERFNIRISAAAAAASLRSGNRPGELENLAGNPAFLPVRLEPAERLPAWRAEHPDQSLAVSALTEDGIVGAPAALPRI